MHEEAAGADTALDRRYPSKTNDSREVAERLLTIDADRMRERGWEVASVTWIENRWVRPIDFVIGIIEPLRLFPRGGSWGHVEVVFRRSTRQGQAEARGSGHPEP